MATLALLDRNLTSLAAALAAADVPPASVTTLNLTDNAVSDLSGLAETCPALQTLILDKNGITSLGSLRLTPCPSVTTLWLNNNAVNDLVGLLDDVCALFPGLTHLACMNNPACAPLLITCEEDVAASTRFRLYAIYRLPRVVFLDAAPVTAAERAEAALRGAFLAPRRAAPSASAATSGNSGGGSGSDVAATASAPATGAAAVSAPATSGSAVAPGAAASAGAGDASRRPVAFLGLGMAHTYDGRHSEGNRFISDAQL